MCSGGLGHSMPAAVGIALAKPQQKVIAVIGDGSSMYAIQALWSAAHLRLPITFFETGTAGVITRHMQQAEKIRHNIDVYF